MYEVLSWLVPLALVVFLVWLSIPRQNTKWQAFKSFEQLKREYEYGLEEH
tara:strand:+ start:392 stop:541 length:150 start_codon:yes stop_codon:yes gene_type:complete